MQMIQSTLSKLMDEAQQPVPLSYSAALENTEDVTHAEQRWKRLTSLVRITLMHAETSLIIVHQETMRNRLEQKALVAYEKARDPLAMAKKQPKARDSWQITKPMAKGQALTRSRKPPSPQGWAKTPQSCLHAEMSGPRGSHSARWVTCLGCGSRWDRVSAECGVWSEAPTPPPGLKLVQNQANSTNQWCPQH